MYITSSILILSLFSGFGPSPAPPEPAGEDGTEVLVRYLDVAKLQQEKMRGLQMEIDIDAKLPKLKKEGRFQALRFISKIGQVTYDHIRFDGDNRIKKDVIGRYLTAESQVQDPAKLAISPENYKFKYKGQHDRDGRTVHVFQLQPKRKAEGLFKGELWVDPETYLPIRESGELVKNPSIFLKKVRFTREFEIRDGVAYPKQLDSIVDTRIAGKAELHISFSNFVRVEIADASFDRPNPGQ